MVASCMYAAETRLSPARLMRKSISDPGWPWPWRLIGGNKSSSHCLLSQEVKNGTAFTYSPQNQILNASM